ncbi:hypothetical protein ACWJJH_16885 [Endozoicomonadaceae bacterium StTr2]
MMFFRLVIIIFVLLAIWQQKTCSNVLAGEKKLPLAKLLIPTPFAPDGARLLLTPQGFIGGEYMQSTPQGPLQIQDFSLLTEIGLVEATGNYFLTQFQVGHTATASILLPPPLSCDHWFHLIPPLHAAGIFTPGSLHLAFDIPDHIPLQLVSQSDSSGSRFELRDQQLHVYLNLHTQAATPTITFFIPAPLHLNHTLSTVTLANNDETCLEQALQEACEINSEIKQTGQLPKITREPDSDFSFLAHHVPSLDGRTCRTTILSISRGCPSPCEPPPPEPPQGQPKSVVTPASSGSSAAGPCSDSSLISRSIQARPATIKNRKRDQFKTLRDQVLNAADVEKIYDFFSSDIKQKSPEEFSLEMMQMLTVTARLCKARTTINLQALNTSGSRARQLEQTLCRLQTDYAHSLDSLLVNAADLLFDSLAPEEAEDEDALESQTNLDYFFSLLPEWSDIYVNLEKPLSQISGDETAGSIDSRTQEYMMFLLNPAEPPEELGKLWPYLKALARAMIDRTGIICPEPYHSRYLCKLLTLATCAEDCSAILEITDWLSQESAAKPRPDETTTLQQSFKQASSFLISRKAIFLQQGDSPYDPSTLESWISRAESYGIRCDELKSIVSRMSRSTVRQARLRQQQQDKARREAQKHADVLLASLESESKKLARLIKQRNKKANPKRKKRKSRGSSASGKKAQANSTARSEAKSSGTEETATPVSRWCELYYEGVKACGRCQYQTALEHFSKALEQTTCELEKARTFSAMADCSFVPGEHLLKSICKNSSTAERYRDEVFAAGCSHLHYPVTQPQQMNKLADQLVSSTKKLTENINCASGFHKSAIACLQTCLAELQEDVSPDDDPLPLMEIIIQEQAMTLEIQACLKQGIQHLVDAYAERLRIITALNDLKRKKTVSTEAKKVQQLKQTQKKLQQTGQFQEQTDYTEVSEIDFTPYCLRLKEAVDNFAHTARDAKALRTKLSR